ncbi:MAG: restriction endonuclease subunit S [Dysgonamonadaceae bacterium]|nr:restriction endonuclease subunit S [Dysgonamonadaceae bacterium]
MKGKIFNFPNLRFSNSIWEKYRVSDLLEFFTTNSLSWEHLEYGTENLYNLHYGLIHKGAPIQIDTNNFQLPNIIEEFTPKKYTLCKNGDVSFADASEDTNDVAKTAEFFNCNDKKIVCGLHTIHGRDKLDITVRGFKGYAFSSVAFRNQIRRLAQGTKVYSVSPKTFSECFIGVPSKEEQTRIAHLLQLTDERVLSQIQIIEGLQSLMKGLSEKLFSQKLRFKDDNGNDFPDWEMTKLGGIATITTGSSNREDSILDGKYTFFDRSQDIRTSHRYLFDKEAVIVPGEGQEFIPQHYIGKFDLHQRAYAIFDFVNINGKFLYYYILSNDKHLQSQAVGSTVKSLRLPMFQSMPIEVPHFQEQMKIANFLSAIDEKLEIEKQILQKYTEQKKYLLANMFI